MKRQLLGIALVHLLFLGHLAHLDAAPQRTQEHIRVNRQASQLWRTIRARTGKVRPAHRLQIKGFLEGNLPNLAPPDPVRFSKGQLKRGLVDASYQRTHPMFQRLAAANWYAQEPQIAGLQRLADNLRANRKIPRSTPMAEVEFLAFDLEATNGRRGSYDKVKGRFRAGYDEIIQFGYAVIRGGRVIEKGAIDIKPTIPVAAVVARITGITSERLGQAQPLEAHAKKILELMQGRILVGHDAIRADWPWLQSNFARLGVHLPGPKGLIADTRLSSFTIEPLGLGLRALGDRFQVNVAADGRFHDAGYDAVATAAAMQGVAAHHGSATLGDLLQLNEVGRQIRANRPGQPAVPEAQVNGN